MKTKVFWLFNCHAICVSILIFVSWGFSLLLLSITYYYVVILFLFYFYFHFVLILFYFYFILILFHFLFSSFTYKYAYRHVFYLNEIREFLLSLHGIRAIRRLGLEFSCVVNSDNSSDERVLFRYNESR